MKFRTVGIRTRVRVTNVCLPFRRGVAVKVREMVFINTLINGCPFLETLLELITEYTLMIINEVSACSKYIMLDV